MARISTTALFATVLDPDSFTSWDVPSPDRDADAAYAADLRAARADTGQDESVRTGTATLAGHRVAVVAGDFDFLAGSVGAVAARRIAAAFDRAAAERLPVLGLPTSGGTRMQEGTPAFLLMAAIAAAVRRHATAGPPFLVYLRQPTTGGVFATWGSLGDTAHAEPGALVGFLGPRVYQGLYGEPFPAGIQTAEGLAGAGVIDGACSPAAWRAAAGDLLAAWGSRPAGDGDGASAPGPVDGAVTPAATSAAADERRPRPDVAARSSTADAGPSAAAAGTPAEIAERADPWDSVTATRAPRRPGLRDLLTLVAAGWVELSGTQQGETAAATVLGVGRIGGRGAVVVGQDRAAQLAGSAIGPADLRVARRGFRLAARWGLPLVTIVDTQGGELSAAAEHGALAGEIARCLADLSDLPTATLALLLGGGSGGAALALLPADRVLAAADSWVTPLPPEGASLIRFRTADRAAEIAAAQRITAADLAAAGAVDRVLASPATDLAAVAGAVADEVAALPRPDRDRRAARWAAIG